MKYRYALLMLTLCLLSACAVQLAVPTETDVNRGRQKFNDITLEQLHQGKQIYELRCQACHKLIAPQRKSEEEWHAIVPKMVPKANRKAGATVITPEDEEILLQYLITMSGRD